ncbi:asparagine synthase (glutamine-hydrolysing) [Amycolatopsis sulphurea]|uniref:asparagine synthase (glutamine-hydrolyzing) n=1 Tax=Amycolatopsis sulphurea TaxID=76022 RepID=A0A2A9FGA8_9PSEU|nr:asparagine synthase-related protein [Amycolatopsis sulphurea]PFG49963.1 asparagine synthase (glutamine-hydrolysing) [Amycolatopsis sulphurea]
MYELTNSLIVVPDSPGGTWASGRIPHQAPEIVAHPSGRPWLVGHWSPDQLVVGGAGAVRIAIFGFGPISAERLAVAAGRVETPADLDRLARALPGSAHLVASVRGQVRFQGTLTGTRPVFTTRIDGVPVAADRADALAVMAGADPDEDMLAVNIACQQLIPPMSERSWWRGVDRVAPDSYLLIREDRAAEVRWWNPPDPVLPVQVGAKRVRAALREAVAWRKPAGRVSADLSGGMDSTTLCFLAAEHTPDLIVFRRTEGSAINDDPFYAGHAARLLDQAEQIELPAGTGPPVFTPPYSLPDTEAPHALVRGMNTIRHQVRYLVERGCTLHLAGHGADELFTGSAAYLHTLIRRQPVTALRHLRVHRALGRWPLLPTMAALWDNRDLRTWWRDSAAALTAPPPPLTGPKVGWAYALRPSPWATGDAVSTARRVLRGIAAEAVPLASDRGQHDALTSLRFAGPLLRQVCREYAAGGLRLDLPYLDDRVVEAALSVRPCERYTPWQYKPVLAEAMRGQVPDMILDRRTKGDYEEEVCRALQDHVPDLLDHFAGSALAARGLIDLDALRTSLYTQSGSDHDDVTPNLEMTLGCETWLRETGAVRRSGPAPSTDTEIPVG